MTTDRIRGGLAPVATPFAADLRPDTERLHRHCRRLLSNGAGLAVFGTNSEASSQSVGERIELLDQLHQQRATWMSGLRHRLHDVPDT